MTDVLDRPPDAEPVFRSHSDDDHRGADDVPLAAGVAVTPVRWFLAALLVGAAAIHLAVAPSHLDESAAVGAGFLAAAWAQLLLAGIVAFRPTRRALAAVAATNLALIVAWAVSRTAGLPIGSHRGDPEPVTFVDGACVALEAIALLLAVDLATRAPASLAGRRGSDGRAARGLNAMAVAGAVGAIALATGAIASPSARDHAAGSHSDGGGGDGSEDTATGDDGTTTGGGDHHGEAEADDGGFAELQNGQMAGHHAATDEPLTAEERVLLAQQLASTAELVERYPTLGDAEAAGWTRQGPFGAALGVHYMAPLEAGSFNVAMGEGGTMDPANMPTPMLIFDGLEPNAPLAGFMYMAYGTQSEPEGFAGPNDHWHYHKLCYKVENGMPTSLLGADDITEEECNAAGGQWVENTGYMVHVWSVPGYESPDGMFSELNRKITCPDGTYYQIDTRELGNRDSACMNT